MAAKVASWKATEPWSFHPVYARYWRHYHQAMAWMRSHHSAYRKAVESYFSCPWSFPPAALPQSSYTNKARSLRPSRDHLLASTDSHCGSSHSRRSGQHPPARPGERRPREHRARPTEEEAESESDGGVECDLSNMEITEELRQYFAQTERHREERRRQQQLDAQRLDDYVNADHDLYYSTRRSVDPPSERPGERRQAEMKRLYGDSAAKIQAMEAAVQLSFDKHCDRKQPKYWPVIPLKF
ncbi:gem-associated protein 8 [Ailuropoda melanoleuca]|uniref:Gem nuclear organelle associated protein 8 n=1 Tax=Ailuropoda melanoleuca TaxID=9646 RepID=A0A7N5JEU2_AILME|nr:gem-associated protein 8 [Ailuropoda melanoleuca]XP_011233319.1 gem-associated protein 8 [Ailuropoda melanoleuca]XP_019663700.1 gem-associated protein 8 [Ailuropoda melanoleuca]XP_019663701.1 gem-associated protein 8 [Ailuropoda melanoleuca]XP_019663702.1 gem-associated protein 8 [Ailuropoda melanoleuca]